jgi:hypothetical protein
MITFDGIKGISSGHFGYRPGSTGSWSLPAGCGRLHCRRATRPCDAQTGRRWRWVTPTESRVSPVTKATTTSHCGTPFVQRVFGRWSNIDCSRTPTAPTTHSRTAGARATLVGGNSGFDHRHRYGTAVGPGARYRKFRELVSTGGVYDIEDPSRSRRHAVRGFNGAARSRCPLSVTPIDSRTDRATPARSWPKSVNSMRFWSSALLV